MPRVRALLAALCLAMASAFHALPAGAQGSSRHSDNLEVVPALRFALGPGFALEEEPTVETDFEATVGASLLRKRSWDVALNAEAGYSYQSGAADSAFHGGNVTIGVGYGKVPYAFLYRPRLLVGTHDDELAVGMRNGISFHFAADLASLEVAHQFLRLAEAPVGAHELRHDITLLLGLNPGAILYTLPASADPR